MGHGRSVELAAIRKADPIVVQEGNTGPSRAVRRPWVRRGWSRSQDHRALPVTAPEWLRSREAAMFDRQARRSGAWGRV